MITYSEYKDVQSKQNAVVNVLSEKINSYPKGRFGLIDDSIRVSPEFRALKNQFDIEFRSLQQINSFGMKRFKKEIYKDRIEKRNKNAIGV
jgi:hypothetical protein